MIVKLIILMKLSIEVRDVETIENGKLEREIGKRSGASGYLIGAAPITRGYTRLSWSKAFKLIIRSQIH